MTSLRPRPSPLHYDRRPIREIERGLCGLAPAFSPLPLSFGGSDQDALHRLGKPLVTGDGAVSRPPLGLWSAVARGDEGVLGLGQDVPPEGRRVVELQADEGEHLADQNLLHGNPAAKIGKFVFDFHLIPQLLKAAIKAVFGGRV